MVEGRMSYTSAWSLDAGVYVRAPFSPGISIGWGSEAVKDTAVKSEPKINGLGPTACIFNFVYRGERTIELCKA